MRTANKNEIMQARGALGLKKRYEERRKIIDKLYEFGGIQPNYKNWNTEQLKILLKAWQR